MLLLHQPTRYVVSAWSAALVKQILMDLYAEQRVTVLHL